MINPQGPRARSLIVIKYSLIGGFVKSIVDYTQQLIWGGLFAIQTNTKASSIVRTQPVGRARWRRHKGRRQAVHRAWRGESVRSGGGFEQTAQYVWASSAHRRKKARPRRSRRSAARRRRADHIGETGVRGPRQYPALRERVPQARRLQSGDVDRWDRLLEGAWSINHAAKVARSTLGGVGAAQGAIAISANCRPR